MDSVRLWPTQVISQARPRSKTIIGVQRSSECSKKKKDSSLPTVLNINPPQGARRRHSQLLTTPHSVSGPPRLTCSPLLAKTSPGSGSQHATAADECYINIAAADHFKFYTEKFTPRGVGGWGGGGALDHYPLTSGVAVDCKTLFEKFLFWMLS